MRTTRRVAVATFIALGLSSGAALAQDYPKQKPITLIVAQAAGSATDQMARILSAKLSSVLGQQIVVDNRAGGGPVIGTQLAANAPADGTLFAAAPSLAINPTTRPGLPDDAVKDFKPITQIAFQP